MVIIEVSNDGGCNSKDTVMVNIPIPVAELSIPQKEFNSKQRDVVIPVSFDDELELLRCKPKFVRIKLEWDFSIFNPRRAFAKGLKYIFSEILSKIPGHGKLLLIYRTH